MSAKLIKNDWKAEVAASGPTAEGMMAGVMSAVTSRMGITHLPGLMTWEMATEELPGIIRGGYVKTCRCNDIEVSPVCRRGRI
eukprot:8785656-Pyramimonas_sp.AAC.1